MIFGAKKLLVAARTPYAMVNDTIVSTMNLNSHSEQVSAATIFRDGGELRSVTISVASGNNPPILRLNRLSDGALLQSFQYRAAQFNGGTGVEASGAYFDGTDLITVERVLNNVFKHAGISDSIRASFASAELSGYAMGLSVSKDGIATAYNNTAHFYAGFTSTVARTITLAKGAFSARFCFDGRNMVFVDSRTLYVINPANGALLRTVDLTSKVPGFLTAIAFDGRNIWVWRDTNNIVYKLGRG